MCKAFSPGCVCYEPKDLKKLTKLITDNKKCKVSLTETDKLLQERFIKFEAAGEAWWQDPTVVVGGIVISASLASLFTVWMIKDK